MQGFLEDQFGLGLIARAVEEGIDVIKPMGIMIFNMGGRPGQAVCKRLFERRGFHVNKLWQTKILQASIPLTIEKRNFFFKVALLLKFHCYRLQTQISQPQLKLKRTVHIVLSSSWDFLEISLFVLGQHGPMEMLVAESLMLYQFTAVNFANQIRCTSFILTS